METTNKAIENFNELVFENRHKAYGAYAIRKSYTDTVTRALFVTCLFFGSLVLLGVLLTNNKIEIPSVMGTNDPPPLFKITEVVLPEIIKEKKTIQKTDVAPKTTSGQMEASDDKNKTLNETNEGSKISSSPNPTGADSTSKTGEPPAKADTYEIEESKKIVKVPDEPPVLKDMQKFIAENLKYPRDAVDGNIEGMVYVSFVVEIDGSVSNVELLKGIGNGCEQEAIRVIKIFPKWKPAIYKGKPVRSQCSLPVKFRLK